MIITVSLFFYCKCTTYISYRIFKLIVYFYSVISFNYRERYWVQVFLLLLKVLRFCVIKTTIKILLIRQHFNEFIQKKECT